MIDLFNWRDQDAKAEPIQAWKPEPLSHGQWPPNYDGVYAWRIKQLMILRDNPELLKSAKAYYSTRPGEFIMHWMDTYNPRKANNKWIPFVFFWRQKEFIDFLEECNRDQENGLVEKCRDAGATWLACGYSVHSCLFLENDAIGWGSRKENLVDKLGDPDSIFEKMRLIMKRLPDIWLPKGFSPTKHTTFMKIINPENGATITGEAGDNIGRGGRKRMYFVDESAHIERAEKVDAALGDNTNVQVHISSVNGLGNVFHRKRKAGIDWQPNGEYEKGYTRVFVIDWRDHPEKTQEWYDQRKARHEREGLQHIFAQEVDRNYSAAVTNTIIPYEWIAAAVDAHLKIPCLRIPPPNNWMAGLDVADGGVDRNALSTRQGIIWRSCEEWGERDPGVTARRAIAAVRPYRGIKVQYDCIGVGSSVKSEYNRLIEDDKLLTVKDVQFIPWNAGGAVINPFERLIKDDDNSARNGDFFGNIKAQAWWSIRTRFYKTFKAVTENVVYPYDELISLDSSMPLLHQLMQELAQAVKGNTGSLKTIVDKQPTGTKSPNLADSGIMMYFPVPETVHTITGTYGL